MDVSATVLSWFAIFVSMIAVGYSRIQAMAVASDDHRKREPEFEITLSSAASGQQTIAIYRLEMTSQQPVDRIAIPSPKVQTPDGRIFPLALTGKAIPKDGIVTFGPFGQGDVQRLSLLCTGDPNLPPFKISITSTYKRNFLHRRESWTSLHSLPNPRVEPIPG